MTQNRRLHPYSARIGFAASAASLYHRRIDLMAEIAGDELLDLAYAWI